MYEKREKKEKDSTKATLDQAIRTGGDFECERCQKKKKKKISIILIAIY